jgi:hypothetical protein
MIGAMIFNIQDLYEQPTDKAVVMLVFMVVFATFVLVGAYRLVRELVRAPSRLEKRAHAGASTVQGGMLSNSEL